MDSLARSLSLCLYRVELADLLDKLYMYLEGKP